MSSTKYFPLFIKVDPNVKTDENTERQRLWFPKDDLQDSSTWSSPPLVLLRDIHNDLLSNYDWNHSAPPSAQPGERSRPGYTSQHRIVTTVEDSVLRTEMGDLESQEEDDPRRIL